MNCKAKDCVDSARANGFCWKHYMRWYRHGDPHKLTRAENGAPMQFIEQAVKYRGKNCLEWPFSKRPYSIISVGNNKRDSVHRVVCKLTHGEPPKGKPNALHNCGNGRCINPKHLYWGTQKENVADAVRHGTAVFPISPTTIPTIRGELHFLARLTHSDVRFIRRSKLSQRVLASKFGVSRGTIRCVQDGTSWGWLP